ncbi:hypothetical protein BHE74_00003565 [Ensete ventricosum]|nr:hypothetical protein BHE74_00003565 [Ensete ventricosum]
MVAPRKETLVPTVLEKEATPCMEGSNKRRDKAVSRPRSMRDLSRVKAQSRDEPFLVQEIVDLPKLSGEGPLEARWATLTPVVLLGAPLWFGGRVLEPLEPQSHNPSYWAGRLGFERGVLEELESPSCHTFIGQVG